MPRSGSRSQSPARRRRAPATAAAETPLPPTPKSASRVAAVPPAAATPAAASASTVKSGVDDVFMPEGGETVRTVASLWRKPHPRTRVFCVFPVRWAVMTAYSVFTTLLL